MGLMNKVNQSDKHFSYLSDDNKVRLLHYGDSRFDDNKKQLHLIGLNYIYYRDRKVFHFPLSKYEFYELYEFLF